ncbi:MAG: adenosylcobinamide-phosphate synthase CbiB [Actinomycetota bacterium]
MIDRYHCTVVLIIAACLDYLIGDPWGWPHPVRAMGWAIARYTQFIFNLQNDRGREVPVWLLRWAGIILGIGLVMGGGTVSWWIVEAANWISPVCGIAVEAILLASCFAGRSLREAALDVLQPLNTGDLIKARERLTLYVGRDTENLSEPEILRAVLETVTENAVDGVMAPLFYALVGAAISELFLKVSDIPLAPVASVPCFAVPLAIAYKAASTLDSMVGYKEAPYTYLGWFSAKLEDALTWLPCRFTVFTLAFLSGKPLYVWKICQRDALKDPSPNSGWSECAYAAVLGVQLGGINSYRGVIKHKPLLGEPIRPITAERISDALRLTRYCFLIWLALSLLFYGFFFLGQLLTCF